ncbi:MAG: TetR family transcriptional regulator [Phycisphaerales bacterium]|nr:TetR family transcriptional regulator [Phycisphaerales bacterium]
MGRVSDAKPRLLQAAMDLVWTRSYGAVTVDDICERAGVKKGSFYYFFKSKDELVAAALDAKWDIEIRPTYDRIFSASRPPLDRLREAFDHVYQGQKNLREKHGCALGCPFSSVGTEIIAADKTLREAVQRMIKGKLRYFESALRDLQAEGQLQGQDAALLAKQVYSYFEGVLAQARIADDLDMLQGVYGGALKLLGLHEPAVAATA